MLETLDYISLTSLENIDRIIEYSPHSYDILIKKIQRLGNYGYELDNTSTEVESKGYIIFTPDKSFVKKIGFFTEDELPIVAIFKSSDNIDENDIIKIFVKKLENGKLIKVSRTFEVIDIKYSGGIRPMKIFYKLAPYRGGDKF